MSVQELEQAILALDDPRDLVTLHEALNRALRRSIATGRAGHVIPTAEERIQAAKTLHGFIRPEQGAVPSDVETREIIDQARLARHG